jgi:low affinity Fe/Cu permease
MDCLNSQEMSNKNKLSFFEQFSNRVTSWTGSSYAFSSAFIIVILWAATGPLFDFSETWQLVINTGTTIITFLMVFLIQKTQNKDSKAIQLKLNELIAADERASNRMVDIEDITEEELDRLHKFYVKLSELAEKEDDIHNSHSIDAALRVNARKHGNKRTLSTGIEELKTNNNNSASPKKPEAPRAGPKNSTPVKKNGK